MFKLVKIPYKFGPYLGGFSDLFTKPGFGSFSHLTSALAVCTKSKTIYNLHETMSDANKEKKSRSAYNWFIAEGDWDENEIAQRKADMFFEAVHLQEGDRILLITVWLHRFYRQKAFLFLTKQSYTSRKRTLVLSLRLRSRSLSKISLNP